MIFLLEMAAVSILMQKFNASYAQRPSMSSSTRQGSFRRTNANHEILVLTTMITNAVSVEHPITNIHNTHSTPRSSEASQTQQLKSYPQYKQDQSKEQHTGSGMRETTSYPLRALSSRTTGKPHSHLATFYPAPGPYHLPSTLSV